MAKINTMIQQITTANLQSISFKLQAAYEQMQQPFDVELAIVRTAEGLQVVSRVTPPHRIFDEEKLVDESADVHELMKEVKARVLPIANAIFETMPEPKPAPTEADEKELAAYQETAGPDAG